MIQDDIMYGWCKECNAIANDGICSIHGNTTPLSSINAIDIHPLPEFEKQFINERLKNFQLGEGIFLAYGDRLYRRRVICLDKPLIEIKNLKDGIHVNPYNGQRGTIDGMDTKSICAVNKNRIEKMAETTIAFSEFEAEVFENDDAIIAFSGGKDSVVLAHLLQGLKLKKVFGDTTIEFPETYTYIKKLKSAGWDIDIAKANQSFFKLCQTNGFPTYENRWCCVTQKSDPFADYFEEKGYKGRILVFSAIRRWESMQRLDQPIRKPHKHIAYQETAQTLLDWLAMDVWTYIWSNKIPINEIYNYFDRCGCWVCPFGLKYRLVLLQHSHEMLYNALQKLRPITENQIKVKSKNKKNKL